MAAASVNNAPDSPPNENGPANPSSMRALRRPLVLGLIAVSIWAFWTQILYPTYVARYELTIEVETPDGIKSGSSVIEARYGWEPTLFGLISGVDNSVIGEAVVVELGGGKNIVVTLTSKSVTNRIDLEAPDERKILNALTMPTYAFGFPSHDRTKTPAGIAKAREMGSVPIPLGKLPLTVTFIDPMQPESIREIDPQSADDTLGMGYTLLAASIKMVNVPPTNLIIRYLPWASEHLSSSECSLIKNNQLRTLRCDDPLIMERGKL